MSDDMKRCNNMHPFVPDTPPGYGATLPEVGIPNRKNKLAGFKTVA